MILSNFKYKKIFAYLFMLLSVLVVFSGCGNKNADDAAQEVADKLNENYETKFSGAYIKQMLGLFNHTNSKGETFLIYDNNKLVSFVEDLSEAILFRTLLNGLNLMSGFHGNVVIDIDEKNLKDHSESARTLSMPDFDELRNEKKEEILSLIKGILNEKISTEKAETVSQTTQNVIAEAAATEAKLSP